MEADWAVALAADDPVITVPWATSEDDLGKCRFIDLRLGRAPDRRNRRSAVETRFAVGAAGTERRHVNAVDSEVRRLDQQRGVWCRGLRSL